MQGAEKSKGGQAMDLTLYNSSAQPLPDEGGDFDKLPDGKYSATCNGFKTGEYRSGGNYIEFEWSIQGPTHAGRRIWQKTTLNHENPDRRKYGEIDRDRIAAAIGLPKLTDANAVVGKSTTITVKNKGEYQNVTFVGAPEAPQAATTMAQTPPPPNTNGAMPWGSSPTPQQGTAPTPGQYADVKF